MHFLHLVTKIIQQNAFVRCMVIDFSETIIIDSVDHVIRMPDLVQLNFIPSFVINWICSFLAGRGQQ